LDTCPFPIFGIEILSLASSSNSNIDVEIYYIDENLTEVLDSFKNSNIFYFDKKKMKKFDVIIANYINFYGEFNTNVIENQIFTE
jgi:hypothetical protein